MLALISDLMTESCVWCIHEHLCNQWRIQAKRLWGNLAWGCHTNVFTWIKHRWFSDSDIFWVLHKVVGYIL